MGAEAHFSLEPGEWSAVAGLALRAPSTEPSVLAEVAQTRFDPARAVIKAEAGDVRAWFAYESVDDLQAFIGAWHSDLSVQFGAVSIGYVLRKGTRARDAYSATIQAAEALLTGDRLFGAGHLTSYAEAQLASYLLSRDQTELHALYEGVIGKLVAEMTTRDGDLVRTLEVYCQTATMLRTAQQLGVHRNTVLYRLKRIEELTAGDLDDGSTRLLFQLGLMAGRVLRQARAAQRSADAAA